MKHIIVTSLCLFFVAGSSAQETGNKTGFSATFLINSNGFSAIPAFSLGKPALGAYITVFNGRFSYDPSLAFSLDMKPWYIDNWLRYKIIKKPSFEIRTGFNFNNYFSRLTIDNKENISVERYLAIEFAWLYKINSKTTITLLYWNDNGLDPGLISGHYVSLQGDLSNVPAGKKILIGGTLQLFTISYNGNNDGLFVSPRFSIGINEFPFSLFSQANIPLWTNIEPNPGYQWTIGLSYSF